ncbi:MAG: aldo/keto reductase [Sulfurimonas sp.]|uniref:aldo/keto reductase n=1 Tax=Sulfurimonas sp. TaxID=2022749 RepID=UPI0025CF07B2|nr:aldo/keto reductase [Sulfurimonas sp.]MCK9492641.1 aldo/keto reductase [Sulfurimonas sp.]
MSNFAFGTYRISDYNPQHIQALRDAISSGIRMIDTSSNYMDGGAERAIALAFREFDEGTKDSVEIVSKVGYIQGSNMDRHKEEPFEEVVEFSPDCFHSISESFIKDQLTESLKRLERTKIDCYLLHNPEYYILDAINRDIDKDEMLDEMYKRIYRAFVALEIEVKNGRISGYGISSNSFSKSKKSDEFLPYEDLIILADKASEEVLNDTHSFTTVQLPINILELEGLKCAQWAKENGLRVLANRPLNAEFEGKMYRLADYDESREYYHHLNELLEICDNEQLKPLYNLFEELDASKHKFGWIGDWDAFFFAQIIPHMRTSLQSLDQESKELLVNSIDMFFVEYKKMVLHECSKNTRKALKEFFKNDDVSMQDTALRFLMGQESIDYVLVGMRKPSYTLEVLALKD